MATESSSLKGTIQSPAQLLKRLEQHDYDSQRGSDAQTWSAGIDDWDAITLGAKSVPHGASILRHYLAARSLVEYGHE